MLILLIRKSIQFYYQNKLNLAKSNSKQVWSVINEITGKPKKYKNNINKIVNKYGIIVKFKVEICDELY